MSRHRRPVARLGRRFTAVDSMALRQALCRFLDRALRRRLAPFPEPDWPASALVVAPHPDDETLGCGGVICRKVAAGADVRFAFVTDGAASHSGRISGADLRAVREREALSAAARLGVPADRVSFLGFPDGAAGAHVGAIATEVEALLRAQSPESIFVVHRDDPSEDHVAVHAAVAAALRGYGQPITVFEYPVWYWYHWPWIGLGRDLPGMRRRNLAQTARTLLGLGALFRLNTIADVSSVAAAKGQALGAHASQMTRPNGQQDGQRDGQRDWPVLADLGGGDFLARLVADHETFLRYEANA